MGVLRALGKCVNPLHFLLLHTLDATKSGQHSVGNLTCGFTNPDVSVNLISKLTWNWPEFKNSWLWGWEVKVDLTDLGNKNVGHQVILYF